MFVFNTHTHIYVYVSNITIWHWDFWLNEWMLVSCFLSLLLIMLSRVVVEIMKCEIHSLLPWPSWQSLFTGISSKKYWLYISSYNIQQTGRECITVNFTFLSGLWKPGEQNKIYEIKIDILTIYCVTYRFSSFS